MIRRPPRSTRTDPLFPSTTLFRSGADAAFRVLELQAGRVERQPAGVEQRPDRAFRIAQQGFVRLQMDTARIARAPGIHRALAVAHEIGRASCREMVCQYVSIPLVAVLFKNIRSDNVNT